MRQTPLARRAARGYTEAVSSIPAAISLLNAYDPANPASLEPALSTAGLSQSYFAQGAAGTAPYDPGTQGPVASTAASGPKPSASSVPNIYQQSLASLQQWSSQTLITSALFGAATPGSTSSNSSSDLTTALENAAQQQQAAWAAQHQAALSAAQAALNAGTQVNTSA